MLTGISKEIENTHILEPIVIVHHLGLLTIEIDELLQLLFLSFQVGLKGFFIKQISFFGFS